MLMLMPMAPLMDAHAKNERRPNNKAIDYSIAGDTTSQLAKMINS